MNMFKGMSRLEVALSILTAPIWLTMMIVIETSRALDWLAEHLTGGNR